MPKIKLLTLDDLYSYYVTQNKNVEFSADTENTQIVVQVPGKASFKKKEAKDKEGLLAVHLQANHTNTNLNGSHIEDDVCLNALNSFKNRPILGYLHQIGDQWEFWGHNMHEDEHGNIEHDEYPIGIIPESCNAELKYDEEKKKNYVEVDGYIFEEYSHAAEILQREEQCDVSVEISIRELTYNAKEKYLDITDYFYLGVTVLGCDDNGRKINPGMAGSNITLANFNQENNSNFNDIDEKLDNFFEKITTLLHNIDSTKGGNSQMTKFEELLAKYNKTAEEIEFEYEGLSDEELENKFSEIFEESTTEENTDESTELTDESQVADEDESTSDEESNQNELNSEDNNEEDNAEENEQDEDVTEQEACGKKKKKRCELDFTEIFSISHEDIKYALYSLLSSYEEADNDWCFIESVYDDYFIYSGMFTGSIYGQKYLKDGDNINFDGERYNLHRELLTDSEYAELEAMRANYSMLKQYKEDAELSKERQSREAVMSDEKYSIISKKIEKDGTEVYENEAYAKLYEEMDNYSCEELDEKLKAIIGEYALSGALNFNKNEVTERKTVTRASLPVNTGSSKKKSRYGNLFEGIL